MELTSADLRPQAGRKTAAATQERRRIIRILRLLVTKHSVRTSPGDSRDRGFPCQSSAGLADEAFPKIDLVDEHICWFEDRGSKPVYLAL